MSRLTTFEIKRKVDCQLLQFDSKKIQNFGNDDSLFDDFPTGVQINNIDGSCSYMNSVSRNFLGYTLEEVQALGVAYVDQIMYDQKERDFVIRQIREFYKRNDESEIFGTFQRVVPRGRKDYEWVYVTSKLKKKKPGGLANERFLVVCPVTHMGDMAKKTEKLLDDNFYFRKYFKQFSSLTKREKEVLVLIVYGYNNPAIAERLFISRDTVAQHRKNLNRKLEFKSYYEMIKFAEVFELI